MLEDEQFIFGGYYLIKISNIDVDNIKTGLKSLISLDENICCIYPSEWAMSGYKSSSNYKKKIMGELKLTKTEFVELQQWIDELFKQHKFGISNVFLDIDSARAFNGKYLKDIEGIKLIGIGIQRKYLNKFFIDNGSYTEYYEGVLSNLSRMIPINQTSKSIGYEILGYLDGGFYSIWTVINPSNLNKLDLKLSKLGLIQNLDLAESYSIRINSEKMSSEPVYWIPWNLYEFNL